jgi:hypothetical protein
MSDIVITAIRLAFPDSRAKRVAIALGCSFMTGRRIWGTGRVSEIYRRQLIETLDRELAENEGRIRQLRRALRGEGNGMSPQAEAGPVDLVGPLREMAEGSSGRAEAPLFVRDGQ